MAMGWRARGVLGCLFLVLPLLLNLTNSNKFYEGALCQALEFVVAQVARARKN